MLDFAELTRLSEGAFDITSGRAATRLEIRRRARVPATPEEISALLPLVGWSKVKWRRPVLTLLPDMEIDFGGIGKEYAVDQALAAAG